MTQAFAVRADAFHTPSRDELVILEDVLVEVSCDGVIEQVGAATPERLARWRERKALIELEEGQYLLPGLIDLHVHAPQWPQAGMALDVPLEDWLQRHTFPLEARYDDLDFARAVYGDLVDALLAHGTTTAVYFATIHVEATVLLAQICLERGQRALVGKVAMDNPDECPPYYRDADAETAIADTRTVIERIRAMQAEHPALVLPVITPRFLPSCTQELLEGLGELADITGCHVQTHCSESSWEVAHGRERFGETDAQVLRRFGLLRTHTILAHCNHVTPGDAQVIKAADGAVAHCPLSNFYFADTILPSRELLNQGVRMGLGSDLAGGHSPSILDAARTAVTASRILASQKGAAALDIVEAFWLATAGGAQALGLPIGRFEKGFEFDAFVVDTRNTKAFYAEPTAAAAHTFEKIVRTAGLEEITQVWVRGRRVGPGMTDAS